MSKSSEKIAILGGGIAGLSVGYFLKKQGNPFTIFEASGVTGGNCRTICFGDFRVDTGAHRFHDKDDQMTHEMKILMGEKISEIHVPSFIYFNNKLVHFPLTPASVFTSLPRRIFFSAVWHFFADKLSSKKSADFESLAYKKYGRPIADLFLTNYSEKLWGEKCSELSLDISGTRLKNLTLKNLIVEFLFRKRKSKHLEGSFYYPTYGFGVIAEELSKVCGGEALQVNSRITCLEAEGNRIISFEINGKQQFFPDILVCTLPITLVLSLLSPQPPVDILLAAGELKFRHLKMVVFLLNRKSVNNAATIYFPDKDFIFTRCYEPRNRSTKMSPEGKTSFVAEIPFSDGDQISKLSDPEILSRAKSNLLSTGLFTEPEIIESYIFVIPNAYPVLKKGYEVHYEKISAYLNQFENLLISGRSGRFEYSWVHNQMRWAYDIAEKIS